MGIPKTERRTEGPLRLLAKYLRIERSAQEEIILELEGHLEDKAEDLTKAGSPTAEAYSQAAAELGHIGTADAVAGRLTGAAAVHKVKRPQDSVAFPEQVARKLLS